MTRYIKRTNRPTYQVVGNGSLSNTGLGEGRFIPVVILDVPEGSRLYDLIRVHQGLTGDANSTWSQPLTLLNPKTYNLEIHFTNPMDCEFAIEFDVRTQYVIIDAIMQTNGVWLQSGRPGDRVSQDMSNKVLVEIPDHEMAQRWESRLHSIVKDSIDRRAKSKREVNLIAAEKIKTMRTLSQYRRSK